MLVSDWSSDVCSSDLCPAVRRQDAHAARAARGEAEGFQPRSEERRVGKEGRTGRPGVPVIENAAQTIGARRTIDGGWRMAGKIATVGTLRCLPSKKWG